jgi:hypothetical protein
MSEDQTPEDLVDEILTAFANDKHHANYIPDLIRADRRATLEMALEIVRTIRGKYPTDVFSEPKPGSPPDCYSAAGCRLACDLIDDAVRKLMEEQTNAE